MTIKKSNTSKPLAITIAPHPDAAGLTTALSGVDASGSPISLPVVSERPLTIFLNRQEIVTTMTVGDQPREMAVGFLFNQNMLSSADEISAIDYDDELGVNLGLKYSPIKRVGFYTPGGKAIYPSSVLMNAVPALVAGVEERVLVSPINLEKSSEILLAAAYLAEVTEFYRMGGAQAIAALELGTKKLKKVYKIVGPGNAYVAEAKRQLFGKVGIDSVAGPSEVLIVADTKNNPEWIALDLLSQAEHDENAQSILITNDKKFGKYVEDEIVKLLETLPRKKIASSSWMILPLPLTGPSRRCKLQLMTKMRLSNRSLEAILIVPRDSGSSISPSPRMAHILPPFLLVKPLFSRYFANLA